MYHKQQEILCYNLSEITNSSKFACSSHSVHHNWSNDVSDIILHVIWSCVLVPTIWRS